MSGAGPAAGAPGGASAGGELLARRTADRLTLTLNRPARRNALTLAMFDELTRQIEAVAGDADLRAVVIRGAGLAFSAGVDVTEIAALHDLPPVRARSTVRAWQRAIASIEEIEVPVVARLHGYVLGGALELASACDFRVAARDSQLAMPEVRLGGLPDGGCLRLVRHIGLGRATELVLAGAVLDGVEAQRIGLVTRAVPEAGLDAAVDELLARVAALAPRAVGLAKRVLSRGAGTDLGTAMELEVLAAGSLYPTADFAEGCAAFQQRRPAHYTGG